MAKKPTKKKAPKGSHYMPNGKLMKGDKHPAKKTKKKVSALDKIQKSLNKLEALHEKQSDMIFDINELIDDAQMDEDDSYHLD